MTAARDVVRGEGEHLAHGIELLELLERCEVETARVDAEITRGAGDADWRRSGAAYDLAAQYSHLHAAGACVLEVARLEGGVAGHVHR